MKQSFSKKTSASRLGKISLLVVMLCFTALLHAQTTYFWVGGASGSYTGSTWSTTRGGTGTTRTPATNDILVIDGNNVGSAVTASAITISNLSTETIGYLYINQKASTATTVTFSSNSATLTVNNDVALSASCTLADGGNTFIIKGSLAAANTGGVTVHSGTGKIVMDGTATKSSLGYISVSSAGSGYTITSTTIGTAWVTGTTYTTGQQVSNGGYLYTISSGTTGGTVAPTHFGGSVNATGGNAVFTFAGIAATASNTAAGAQSTTAQAFTISQGGCGYTSAPTVTVAGGTGGSFTANLVNAIALTNNGSTLSVGNMDISNGANILLAANMNFQVNGQLDLKTSGNLALNARSLFFNATSTSTSGNTGTLVTSGGTLSGGVGPSTTSVFTGGSIQFNGSVNVGSVQTLNFPTSNANACSLTNIAIGRLANCSIKFGTCTNKKITFAGTLTVSPASGGPYTNQIDDGGNVYSFGGGNAINSSAAVATTVNLVSTGGKLQLARSVTGNQIAFINSNTSSVINIDSLELTGGSTTVFTVTVNGSSKVNVLKRLTFTNGSAFNGTGLTIGDGTNPVIVSYFSQTATGTGGFNTNSPTWSGSPISLNYFNSSTTTASFEITGAGTNLKDFTDSATGTLALTGAITIKNGNSLFLKAGTLNNSSATITLNNGATISRGAGSLSAAPVFGSASTDRVAVIINSAVTSGNEILGTTGKIGTLTVNGAFTYTLGSNVSLDGLVVNNAGGQLNASTFTISENTAGTLSPLTNSGIIKTSNTGTTPLPTGKAWPGIVQYAGTSGHIVSATSYTNLTTLNASGSLTNDANLTVTGTLTTTSGGTLALGAFTLSTAAVSNGGTISTTSTSTTPITSSLDYSGASNTGSVQFLGSGAQTMPTATYGAVTLTNTAGVTLGGDATIGGTLSFGNGTTVLTVGANTLTLKGAVNITSGIAAGSINASNASATVVYSGTSAQTINNFTYPNPGGVNNLTIANSAGVTLSMPVTVAGTLTLTSGRVTTTATNILIASSGATVSTASTTSYINGPFRWSLPASYSTPSTLVFPIGLFTGGTDYYYGLSLVNPTTGGSATTITATAFQSLTGGSIDASLASINTSEYWSLAYTGSFSGADNIALSSATASGSNNNTIGTSGTQAGTYSSIGAGALSNSVLMSSSPITSSNQFFALGILPQAYGITSIVPTSAYSFQNGGLAAAYYGQTISINGSGLNTVTSLTVNGSASIAAASFVSQSSTLITVNVPSDAALSGNVVITDGVTPKSSAFTVTGFVSNASTDWNTGSTWLGGNVPSSGATVAVNNAVTLAATATNNPGTLTVQSGSSLTFGASGSITITTSLSNSGTINQTSGGTLTLSSGASFANSGTFTAGVGTVIFGGTGTITGTTPSFYNITLNGTLTVSSTPSSPTINNNLVLNTTTSSLSSAPTYGSSATLVYKAGPRTVGNEWANFRTGAINTISILAPGSGYTSVPTITGTGGTGLTATASLGVATIAVVGSSGYTSIPSVSITGGGGSGATAVAYIKAGVLSISVTSNGSGYTSVPTVNVTGGGGSLTSATASLGVFGVTVTSGGSGYTTTGCTVTGTSTTTASVVAIPSVGLGIPPNVTVDAGSGNTITSVNNSGRACSGTLNINSGTFLLNGGQVYMGNNSGGGTLIVNSGATLDLATTGIFSTGTLNTSSTNGTIRSGTNSTTAYQYPFPANLTWGGTLEYYAPTTNNTRITPGTFNNVNLDFGINNGIVMDNVANSSATYTFNGTVTLNNASSSISTPNFTTVIFNGSSQSVPGNTNFYNLTLGTGTTFPTGSVSIQNNFNTNGVAGATQGTINFTGTHAQTVPAFNYNNLTISGTSRSGNVTLASSGTIGIAGTFTNSATYTSPAALVTTGSTISYNGTGAQSVLLFNYNNLTIAGTRSGTPIITLPSGTINVAGFFSTSQTGAVSFTTSGNTLNLNGSGSSTISSPFTHQILNVTSGTLNINAATTASGLATISNGATLSLGSTYTNTGGLTQNGVLQINGGSVTASPVYSGTSSLVYKATATVGNEWIAGGTLGSGVPQTVTIDAVSGTVTTPGILRTVVGDLTITNGTLALGGDIQVNGNWANNGAFTPGSNTVIFGGSSASSITTPETFYNLQVNDAAGVTLSSPVSVSNILTLTNGVLTSTSSNLLTITNTSNSGVSGGNSSSYVEGPLKWNLPSNFSSAATYTYPVGKNGTYLKFALVNPTTGSGTVSAKVEAFDAGSTGGVDGTLSAVNGEYWSLNTTGNYTGVGNVALTSASVANSSVVARSTGGTYTSKGGSSSSGTVTSTATIGTGATQYFAVGLIPGVSLGAVAASSPTFAGQATATGYYGQTITINGNGFTGSTTVTINGAAATVLTHTTTQLTAKVPAASAASGNLVVTDGAQSDNTSFTVLGYVTNAASDWNTTTTWLGNVVPVASANVFVRHAITINGTVTKTPTNVTVVSGSSITYGASGSLTVNTALTNAGSISMASGGTLTIKGTFTNTGTLTASAGTVVFNGTIAQTIPTPVSSTYYNLTINNASSNTAPGALTVNGQLTIASGSTLDMGTNILSGAMTQQLGSGTLLAGANSTTPIPSGVTWAGSVNYTGTGAQTVVAGAYNNLTVAARTGSNVTLISGGTISVAGTFTPGTLTSGSYVVTSNTFSFNGSSAQSVPAFTFTNLIVANSNGIISTAAGALLVNTSLQINDGATLDLVSNQLTGSSLTTSNGGGTGTGTLKTQNTTSTPIPTGRTWNFGVTYNNASGTQTVMAGTYNGTLNSAGTSGTNTTSGVITVNGALLIGSGHTLNISTFGIASASTINPSGIQGTLLTMSNGAGGYQYPANKTWGGSVVYGGPINNRLVPGTYYNLDVDNGVTGHSIQLDGIGGSSSTAVFNISGTFRMSPTNNFVLATLTTVNFTGTNQVLPACANMRFYNVSFGTNTNMQAGSGMTVQNIFTPNNTTGVTAGTITFSNSNTQTIPVFNYYSLSIGGTRTTNNIAFASGGTITIPGNLTINHTTSAASIGNNINLSGSLSPVLNVSATLVSASTTVTCPTTGLDIGMIVIGSGIPTGATISTIGTGSITISSAATSSTSSSLSFYPVFNLNNGAYNGKVTIPSGKTFYSPTTMTVNSGGTVTNNGTFNLVGALTNNGTITGSGTTNLFSTLTNNSSITSTGNTNLVGTAAQTISGNGSITNLTLNNSLGATITGGAQSLTGVLTISNGNFNTGTNRLILKSTSISNTAIVDKVLGSLQGTVQVERFIPAGFRGYRDIAPEVYNAGSMFLNWQENGSLTSGSGIFITGTTALHANSGGFYNSQPAPDANGLDYSINGNVSAYSYTNGSAYNAGFNAIANTKTTTLDAFSGYRVLVRGDRSFNLATTPIVDYYNIGLRMVNDTKLRATGNLVYGDVTYDPSGVTATVNGSAATLLSTNGLTASTTNGFSMIANPYVCPVLWGTGVTGTQTGNTNTVFGNSSNVNGSYWYLDPTASASGKYIAFNAITGSATVGGSTYPGSFNGTTNNAAGYIQPGQAFFVQSSSASPSVVFTENCKAVNSTKTSVFGVSKPMSKIYLSLMKEDSVTFYARKDGAAIAFAASFGNTFYGPQDALKFTGANDNLFISDKGKNLSIDGRLPATASDVLPIALSKLSGKNYKLVINASVYEINGFVPMLKDSYRGVIKSLSTGIDTINFTVDTSIAATYSNRFSIVFKATTLAVNSIVATATLNNKIANVSWNTVGEKGVSRFEVEKSTDAKSFVKIGQVNAKNTSIASYNTSDNNISAATNYYRIKAISEVGTVSYSNIVKVSSDNRLPSYSLYPNPLKGTKVVNVSLTNVAAGNYTVVINNVLGQRVQEVAISHAGGNGSHALTVNSTIAAGTYSVTVRDANGQAVYQSNLSVQP